MSSPIVDIRFGGEQVEYVAISVRGRAYRQSRDYWDGNWLLVTVEIRAGKFSGNVPGVVRAEELHRFRDALRAFQQTPGGAVSFETKEQWLALRLEADTLGHLELSGTLRDDVAYPHNKLVFALKFDPALLASALRQLEQAAAAFPVIGLT